jgi:hypothetical protein
MVYFPPHLKYQRVLPLSDPPPTAYGAPANDPTDNVLLPNEDEVVEERVDGYRRAVHVKVVTAPEWRLAITLAWVVAVHL